jgi:hypothetical protein
MDLNKMKISDLKSIIEEEGIYLPRTTSKSSVNKTFLISAIIDHRSKENGIDEISIPSFKCGTKKNKCAPKACSVDSGECLPVLSSGDLYKSVEYNQQVLHGNDYYFDKKSGLVGKKADVNDHIKHWNSSKSQSKRSSSKPKSQIKKRCDSKINPLNCEDDQLCSADTGSCVNDTASYRKGKYILDTDGRLIVGNKDTIEKLQNILGGNITIADKIKPTSSPGKKSRSPSPGKKSRSPSPGKKSRSPSPGKKSRSPSPGKKSRSPSPGKKSSSKKQKDFQDKIDSILSEEDSSNLQKKSSSQKYSKSKSSSSFKLGEAQNDIYETFAKCLSGLE